MTQEFNLVGVIRPPTLLSDQELKTITSEVEAIATCWAMRRVKCTQKTAAKALGINQGVFSQILNGQRAIPTGKRLAFQWFCGNTAVTQWEALQVNEQLANEIETPKRRESDHGGRRAA